MVSTIHVTKHDVAPRSALATVRAHGGAIYRRGLQKLLAHHQISRVAGIDHPAAPRVAEALSAMVDRRLSHEERAFVAGIEALRTRLEAVETHITVVDHGIGRPDRS